MSEGFDPYYQWLGIPPKHQPPNHYRLLGLEEFEENPDVIESAADRQIGHVRLHQTGPHAQECQDLCNEITSAKLCLLNAAKKADYDGQLRADREIEEAPAGPPKQRIVRDVRRPRPQPPQPAPPLDPSVPVAQGETDTRESFDSPGIVTPARRGRPAQRQRFPLWAQASIAGTVLGIVIVAVLFAVVGGGDTTVTENPRKKEKEHAKAKIKVKQKENVEVPPAKKELPAKKVEEPPVKVPGPVNLLAMVDPALHRIGNSMTFTKENGQLVTNKGATHVHIPYTPPAEYDITMTAQRLKPGWALKLVVVADRRQFLIELDRSEDGRNRFHGISSVDGQESKTNDTRRDVERMLFRLDGRPVTVTYQIRRNGVRVLHEGTTIFDWQGDFRRCSMPPNWNIPHPSQFTVYTQGRFAISKLELTPFVGTSSTPGEEYALQFRDRDRVELANTPDLLPEKSLTAEMWVRIDPDQRSSYLMGNMAYGGVHSEVPRGKRVGWLVYYTRRPGTGRGILSVGVGRPSYNRTIPALHNHWHHIAVCFEAAQPEFVSARVFLDGRLIISARVSPETFEKKSPTNLYLGVPEYSSPSPSVRVAGEIRAFRLSSTSRHTQSGFTPPQSFSVDEHTTALLDFTRRPNGDEASDLSGKGHDGKITGARWVKVEGQAADPGQVVDLLKQIDLKRDVAAGAWRFEDGALIGKKQDPQPGQAPIGLIRIPTQAPVEYDLELVAKRLEGNNHLAIGLISGSNRIALLADNAEGRNTLLGNVKTEPAIGSAMYKGGLFADGQTTTLLCSVRRTGIEIVANGRTIGRWRGDPAGWSVQSLWAKQQIGAGLFLGVWDSTYRIEKLVLRPVGVPTGGQVADLLKAIDLNRDLAVGEGDFKDGTLIVKPQENSGRDYALLQIPHACPDEYDLELAAKRTEGGGPLVVGLISGSNRIGLHCEAFEKRVTTLTYVKDQVSARCEDRVFTPNNKTTTLICRVRKSSLTILADGKPILNWQGDPSQWGLIEHWLRRPIGEGLFLAVWNSTYHIEKLTLRPAGGSAPPPPSSSVVYLDDLREKEFQVGYGTLGKHGQRGYRYAPANDLCYFKGKRLTHALSAHPATNGSAHVTYELNGAFSSFRGTAGKFDMPPDEVSDGALTFKIYADEKLLWQSGPIQRSGTGEEFAVNVRGVQTLKLHVDCPGSAGRQHAAWILPRLTREASPPVVKRLPLPNDAEIAAALQKVKDAYKEDYEDATTPERQIKLAETLFRSAISDDHSAAVRVALLRESRDLAAEAVDTESALKAAEQLADRFQIDGLTEKVTLLKKLAAANMPREKRKVLVENMLLTVEDAASTEKFDVASELASLTYKQAAKVADTDLRKQADDLRDRVEQFHQWVVAATAALKTLADSPDDPAANTAVGQFLCFVKEEWDKGLSHLAKSDNEKLKTAAQRELAKPTSGLRRALAGDAWFDLAIRAKNYEKLALQTRAYHWYRQAVKDVEGEDASRVKTRLALLEKDLGTSGGVPSKSVLAERILGKFYVVMTANKDDSKSDATYEFTSAGEVREVAAVIGKWAVKGASVRITFTETTKGTVNLRGRGADAFEGVQILGSGETVKWDVNRLVITVWNVYDENQPTAPARRLELFSNGKGTSSRYGEVHWSLKGNTITITKPNFFKGTYQLQADRKTFRGRSAFFLQLRGERVTTGEKKKP